MTREFNSMLVLHMLVVVIFPSMSIVIVLITQLVESCSLPTVRVVT